MVENVREMASSRPPVSEIKNLGATTEDFLKGNLPTGRELSSEEKSMFMRKKKIANIVITIKATSGDAQTTLFEDTFNLHVIFGKRGENVVTVNQHLDKAKGMTQELITAWEKEI